MIEVADIFRQHAAAYQAAHSLLPSQIRALRDIERCRTAFFGGQLTQCDHCGQRHPHLAMIKDSDDLKDGMFQSVCPNNPLKIVTVGKL